MKFLFPKNVYETNLEPIPVCPEYVYKQVLDEHGVETIVVDYERDIQAEMDAFAADTNIYNIIARHEAGDVTALNSRGEGIYPTKEMVDAAQSLVRGESLEAKLYQSYLDFDVKDLSFEQFSKLINEGKYNELLEMKKQKSEVNE